MWSTGYRTGQIENQVKHSTFPNPGHTGSYLYISLGLAIFRVATRLAGGWEITNKIHIQGDQNCPFFLFWFNNDRWGSGSRGIKHQLSQHEFEWSFCSNQKSRELEVGWNQPFWCPCCYHGGFTISCVVSYLFLFLFQQLLTLFRNQTRTRIYSIPWVNPY